MSFEITLRALCFITAPDLITKYKLSHPLLGLDYWIYIEITKAKP